jgi:formylglycine-generating enzyme required for sulfatase activity
MKIQFISQSLLLCAFLASPFNRAVSIDPLVELSTPTFNSGAVELTLNGPAGTFSILTSENLQDWTPSRAVTKTSNPATFNHPQSQLPATRFYKAVLFVPPTNMVYIAPNTFVMGSPITELHRQTNEGPQTTVTLSHGYWIGKFEVTQAEYLDVTGTNPSNFPEDLTRPVSSVSWPDTTNYCALLTQRELAAGRIPPGYRFRLPTEAEWECAARAGATTRFSYGDDINYTELPNHAWYFMNAGLTVHPVGQKLPNPWGLYDMEGNVWEWTQDWLSDRLPGGAVTDPQGAPSNEIGWKVIRGGGYDFGETDCRSAKRYFFGNHPALTDTNLGFRAVLAPDP